MVAANQQPISQQSSDDLRETLSNLQEEYESAGVNPMIAETAAAARVQQEQGEPLDDIDQEVLGFAEGIRGQQEQLANLPQYQESLEENGFDQASQDYEGLIPAIEELTTPESVEERQVAIASDLTDRGVSPNTSADIQARVGAFRTAAVAVGDDEQPPMRTGISDDALGADASSNGQELERELQMLTDAQTLMQNAREAGIAAQDGNSSVLQGENYRIFQQGDTTVIEGDGKKLIADGRDVLKVEGFDDQDFERFERLGQRSIGDLQKEVKTPSQGENERNRTQRQRQITVQRSKGIQL